MQDKFVEDHALFEAKFTSMNDALADFETRVKQQVAGNIAQAAVDATFKQQVAAHFTETVAAMQWLDTSIDIRPAT